MASSYQKETEESASSSENLYTITKEIFDKKAMVSDRHVSSLCYIMKSTCIYPADTEQSTKAQAP